MARRNPPVKPSSRFKSNPVSKLDTVLFWVAAIGLGSFFGSAAFLIEHRYVPILLANIFDYQAQLSKSQTELASSCMSIVESAQATDRHNDFLERQIGAAKIAAASMNSELAEKDRQTNDLKGRVADDKSRMKQVAAAAKKAANDHRCDAELSQTLNRLSEHDDALKSEIVNYGNAQHALDRCEGGE
jgi:chromosome segregation ATPase